MRAESSLRAYRSGGRGLAGRLVDAAICGYFWPTIVAAERDHRQLEVVAGLNLLAGWTAIGWLAAILWARRGTNARVRFG